MAATLPKLAAAVAVMVAVLACVVLSDQRVAVESLGVPKSLLSLVGEIDLAALLAHATAPENRLHTAQLAVVGALALAALVYVAHQLFSPYERHRTLHEIQSCDELSGMRGGIGGRSRKAGSLPPPYPNGWFKIMESRELALGEVKSAQFLGQHLVAFRGHSGRIMVLDAYCPHLGANLSAGGKVVGDSIVCPFHGWQFDGASGRCTSIPYSSRPVPEVARTRAWHVQECNKQVYLWFDAEGRAPTWHVQRSSEIDDEGYRYHGSTSHEIQAHCQEMPENGADFAHLNFLHVPCAVSRLLSHVILHRWFATWKPGKADDYYHAYLDLHQHMELFGFKLPGTYVHVDVTQEGPGLVFLRFQTPVGRLIVIETVTPIAPLLQSATHVVYASWWLPRFIGKFVLYGLVVQFERDMPIWNNKTFVPSPMVVEGDGPIAGFRRWYQAFYSESSAKFRGSNGPDW